MNNICIPDNIETDGAEDAYVPSVKYLIHVVYVEWKSIPTMPCRGLEPPN